MQKALLPKQAGILTVALLIACPLLNSSTGAMSVRQAVLKTPATHTDPGTMRRANQSKTAVLVRNTSNEATAKADKTDATPAVKTERLQDKKAAGRCWKRLMNSFREIRHAHKKD